MDVITVAGLGARSWPGVGRPVLLVHGLAGGARLWDEVADALHGPVVTVDLRGHGSSVDVPSTGDPTRQAAADLAAVCAELGWDAPVVAGQSWGGNVALQLAADHPDLVHGLALVDGGWIHQSDRYASPDEAWEKLAPPPLDGIAVEDMRELLHHVHPTWSDAAIEATLGNLRVLPDGTVTPWLTPERYREVLRSLFAHRPRELYPLVRCPVLLLAAGTPKPLVEEAAAALKDARVVAFPGGDHDLHAQQPLQVAAEIEKLTT